jgi:hypothetical protein
VWGDSDIGVGVFGSTGPIPAAATDIPVEIAGVEGYGFERPGVVGRSLTAPGVDGESAEGLGVLGRSGTGNGMLGVTFNAGDPRDGSGVFGSSTANGNGVTGFVGSQTGKASVASLAISPVTYRYSERCAREAAAPKSTIRWIRRTSTWRTPL